MGHISIKGVKMYKRVFIISYLGDFDIKVLSVIGNCILLSLWRLLLEGFSTLESNENLTNSRQYCSKVVRIEGVCRDPKTQRSQILKYRVTVECHNSVVR
jgi:hypothetical protein